MPARYDSPTQTGDYDDCDADEWDNYYSDQEAEEDYSHWGYSSDYHYYGTGPDSRPHSPNGPRLHSSSRTLSRGSSTLSFSVLDSEDRSDSPQPARDSFEPLTPSRDLQSPTAPSQPLPSLHEWYGQPLYDILTLPDDNSSTTPQSPQSVDAVPAPQPEPDASSWWSTPAARQPALELSQFFDDEAARLFNELLHQPNQSAVTEADQSDDTEEPEERYIIRDEDIDLSAIRDRSVMDVHFAHEMPVLEPEVPLASAPQPGYTPPEEFEPAYNHPIYDPPSNDGQMSHAVEALPYLCAALQIDEDQLKWTLLHRPLECFNHLIGMTVFCHATGRLSSICHMTALTPETHVSITGTKYVDYLRNQSNYTVRPEHKQYPLVELADRFLAPLDSLVLYYHV